MFANFNIIYKRNGLIAHFKLEIDIPYPFFLFGDFLQEMSKIRNDEGIPECQSLTGPVKNKKNKSTTVLPCETEVELNKLVKDRGAVFITPTRYYSLKDCKTLRSKSLS